jgi:hypothetical protein
LIECFAVPLVSHGLDRGGAGGVGPALRIMLDMPTEPTGALFLFYDFGDDLHVVLLHSSGVVHEIDARGNSYFIFHECTPARYAGK